MFIVKTPLSTVTHLFFSFFFNFKYHGLRPIGYSRLSSLVSISQFFLCFIFDVLAGVGPVHFLFSPFNSSVLKPDFHLCFSEIQRSGEIMSLGSDHVLLPVKLFFQSLELFWRENRTNSLRFSLLEIPRLVFFMVYN